MKKMDLLGERKEQMEIDSTGVKICEVINVSSHFSF